MLCALLHGCETGHIPGRQLGLSDSRAEAAEHVPIAWKAGKITR